MSISRSKKLDGICGTNFKVKLEYNEEYVIIHFAEITKMDTKVYREMRKMLKDWSEFFKTIGVPFIWAGVETDNPKISRLAIGLGFKYMGYNDSFHVYRYGEE